MKTSDEEKMFIYVIFIIVACFVGWLFFVSSANAREMNNEECYGMATDIHTIAVNRDSGISEAKELADVRAVLEPFIGVEDSYIRTQGDLDFMLELVHKVYASKMSAKDIANSAYNQCLTVGFGPIKHT